MKAKNKEDIKKISMEYRGYNKVENGQKYVDNDQEILLKLQEHICLYKNNKRYKKRYRISRNKK